MATLSTAPPIVFLAPTAVSAYADKNVQVATWSLEESRSQNNSVAWYKEIKAARSVYHMKDGER